MSLTVELPQGSNLDRTASTLQTIHERLGKHPEINHVITNLGSAGYVDNGTNLASSSIKLVEPNRPS